MSVGPRIWVPGGRYAFTVNTHLRQPLLTLPGNYQRLVKAFVYCHQKLPFELHALAILPDHLHTVWKLPEGDDRFDQRWIHIKRYFSLGVKSDAPNRRSRIRKRERNIWQRRYWHHVINNNRDWNNQINYAHTNAVRHGYCDRPQDWPYSTYRYFQTKNN